MLSTSKESKNHVNVKQEAIKTEAPGGSNCHNIANSAKISLTPIT